MSQSTKVRKNCGALTLSTAGVTVIGDVDEGVTFQYDGVDTLNIDGTTANDIVRFGETTQVDVRMDGGTDLVWDASAGSLANGGMIVPVYPNAEIDTDTTDMGTISVTSPATRLSTAAPETRTLPNGTVVGQMKQLVFIVNGGDCVVTISLAVGGAGRDVITFDEVGQSVDLMWTSLGWRIVREISGDSTLSFASIA